MKYLYFSKIKNELLSTIFNSKNCSGTSQNIHHFLIAIKYLYSRQMFSLYCFECYPDDSVPLFSGKLPQLKAPWKTPEMKHCWSHSLDRKQHSRWRWGKIESCGWFCLPGGCPHLHCFENSWEQILSLTVEAKQGSPVPCGLHINDLAKSIIFLRSFSLPWICTVSFEGLLLDLSK